MKIIKKNKSNKYFNFIIFDYKNIRFLVSHFQIENSTEFDSKFDPQIKGLKELGERCGKYGDKIRFKNLPNGYQYCYLKMDDYVSFLEAKTTSANTATGGK